MIHFQKTPWAWRACYLVCSLLYIALLLVSGRSEFSRVNKQYRQAGERLQPSRVNEAAVREIRSECRQSASSKDPGHGVTVNQAPAATVGPSAVAPPVAADECRHPPRSVVAARAEQLRERLTGERRRAFVKFVLFYLAFVLFFLIMPLALLYWLFISLLALFRLLNRPDGP